ncbi:hypothetical protein [Amycolatopsis sp. VC5-11]|uniref:hypothetical protein n=1 Tax=Amycolatopsis sp. VC5-11 TaxID=3120156 RepID=UPI003009A545
MVHTGKRRQSIAAAAALAAVAGGGVTAVLALNGDPAIAANQTPAATGGTSSAYGVAGSSTDNFGPTPTVSSAAEVRTASGSYTSKLGIVASGMTVKAGNGFAEATVASVRIGNVTVGPVSMTCRDGKISYTGSGPAHPARNLSVSYHNGAGATIVISGAGTNNAGSEGGPALAPKQPETITVAVAKCEKGTTPPTSAPPTGKPTGRPTGKPTAPPTDQPTGQPPESRDHEQPGPHPGRHQPHSTKPEQPAPAPKIVGGRRPIVTG